MLKHYECLARRMGLMPKNHQDTSISLHPLSFEDAIKALAKSPKREGSQAEESGSTTEAAPKPSKDPLPARTSPESPMAHPIP